MTEQRRPPKPSSAQRSAGSSGPQIHALDVSVYRIPTDAPESDGTLSWDSTTIVVVEPRAGGIRGLGYGYADAVAGRLIIDTLAPLAIGRSLPGSTRMVVR